MELEDEVHLVSRLLSGDTLALDQFVLAYRRFIISILSRQSNLHSEDVEELYQRFLLHIWEDGYRRLRPWSGTRSLRAYLGAVARNLARDYRRERSRTCNGSACGDIAALPARENRRELDQIEMLNAALERLPARDRELIHRRYFLDESYREIAQALGITVNHVGVVLFRAESRLKVILKKHRNDL